MATLFFCYNYIAPLSISNRTWSNFQEVDFLFIHCPFSNAWSKLTNGRAWWSSSLNDEQNKRINRWRTYWLNLGCTWLAKSLALNTLYHCLNQTKHYWIGMKFFWIQHLLKYFKDIPKWGVWLSFFEACKWDTGFESIGGPIYDSNRQMACTTFTRV